MGSIGRLVAHALVLAPTRDEEELQSVVAELAQNPDGAITELQRRSGEASPDDIGLRWTLLYVTSMLRELRSMSWLTEIACEALPDDPAAAEACESRIDSEVLVRVMGTEAVVELLGIDEQAASEALLKIIELQPHVAIRAVAGQALLEHDPSFRDSVLDRLPHDQRFVVDLRREPYTSLSVDPESLPSGKGETASRPPSPDAKGEDPGDPSGSAPSVSGSDVRSAGPPSGDCECGEGS
jgi:hypothetical protein